MYLFCKQRQNLLKQEALIKVNEMIKLPIYQQLLDLIVALWILMISYFSLLSEHFPCYFYQKALV